MNKAARIEAITNRTDPPEASDAVAMPAANGAWHFAAQAATIGIFLLLFVGFLNLARNVVLPIVSAIVIGIMLTPLARRAERWRIPPVVFSVVTVGIFVAAIYVALISLTGPIADLVQRAPEFGPAIKNKLAVFEPAIVSLKALQDTIMPGANEEGVKFDVTSVVQPVVAFLTPAVGELIVFLATLFLYMLSRDDLRRSSILFFPEQDDRLSVIQIFNDVEEKLTRYFGTVTAINLALGIVTAIGAYFIGLPNPALFGLLAFFCNYVPYIGAGFVLLVLFIAGLIVFPSLGQALIPPALFLAVTTFEGHFVTPNVMGRQFTVSPLAVFVALAFWTWLWGPIGGFLSVPILIIGLVILNHIFPKPGVDLPG